MCQDHPNPKTRTRQYQTTPQGATDDLRAFLHQLQTQQSVNFLDVMQALSNVTKITTGGNPRFCDKNGGPCN